jgi:PKD repeat protein
LWAGAFALAALVLAPVSEVLADHHVPGRDAPWGTCTICHGSDLMGGSGPSCMSCHSDFTEPDPPASGHHMTGRDDPASNCSACHGQDLMGGIGPSCFTCHDALWPDPGTGNQPPVVDSGGPYQGLPGEPLQFDASGTVDADGDTLIYLWAFGDGSVPQFPNQSPLTTHTFENAGSYTGVLTVTDGSNDLVMVDITIVISSTSNAPPIAVAGGPYMASAGESVQLNGSGSSDPDGDPLTYSWDFGDGTAPTSAGSSPNASHVYTADGFYTAVLTVDDGVNSPRTASATVEIVNLPPVALAGGPYSGAPAGAIQFNGSSSFDPEGDTLTYSWNFGDGTAASAASSSAGISHTYAAAGSYTAVLTVDDGVNSPQTASASVTIFASGGTQNPPPCATGNDWTLLLPFASQEITVSFEEFAGILLVHTTPLGGQSTFGIGMEFDGLIFWMDVTGSLFYGSLDQTEGTGWGMVFGYQGATSSVWFAERQ